MEPFTIRVEDSPATWTRATLDSAKRFADARAKQTGVKATVTLTETG